LWIDHRKAVIVIVADEGEETRVIESNVEKHVRFSGGGQREPEDSRERRVEGDLGKYYDEVIASMRGVEAILIFGPGEAKGELEKRLRQDKSQDRIVAIETVDKMTDRQIAAKVRQRFPTATR
jgi:stalled ribosome rescue protein Dom34